MLKKLIGEESIDIQIFEKYIKASPQNRSIYKIVYP